jgi:hypothetical protein
MNGAAYRPTLMRPDELERRLRKQLNALGPAPRAELLHVLILPDYERVGGTQSYSGNPKSAPSANRCSTFGGVDAHRGKCQREWSERV